MSQKNDENGEVDSLLLSATASRGLPWNLREKTLRERPWTSPPRARAPPSRVTKQHRSPAARDRLRGREKPRFLRQEHAGVQRSRRCRLQIRRRGETKASAAAAAAVALAESESRLHLDHPLIVNGRPPCSSRGRWSPSSNPAIPPPRPHPSFPTPALVRATMLHVHTAASAYLREHNRTRRLLLARGAHSTSSSSSPGSSLSPCRSSRCGPPPVAVREGSRSSKDS